LKPKEETTLVRTEVPVSLLKLIDEFNERLAKERRGPVTRAQALRELLDLGVQAAKESSR
jgi:hypothetical protein